MSTIQYKDLDFRFSKNPINSDVSKSVGDMAVVRAMRNLILTALYERPFQPDLGSSIRSLLFENHSAFVAAALQKEIENTIINHEPRVTLQETIVLTYPEKNAYKVVIRFYIKNSATLLETSFFLERLR